MSNELNLLHSSSTFDEDSARHRDSALSERIAAISAMVVNSGRRVPKFHQRCSKRCPHCKESQKYAVPSASVNRIIDIDSSLEELATVFPHDVKRLQNNFRLKESLILHQRGAPFDISQDGMNKTVDVFSMPVSVSLLPEVTWKRMGNLFERVEHSLHLNNLITSWKARKDAYPIEAWTELKKKIMRNFKSGDEIIRKIEQ